MQIEHVQSGSVARPSRMLVFFMLLLAVSALLLPEKSFAQFDAIFSSIAPNATEVTDELPPLPARQRLFGWQGVSGQSYSITFQATSQPALVVGIGCRVDATSYDQNVSQLTVNVTYLGEQIQVDDAIQLPAQSFLIALDPGVDPALLESQAGSVTGRELNSDRCYGPGADLSRYRDEGGDDFGDDGGLSDPDEPGDDGSANVGLPFQAAGTFASTSTFYWCLIPTLPGVNRVGFDLVGSKSSAARLDLFLSSGLLNFLSQRDGKTVSAANLAIFSDTQQVSVDVSADGDGASASLRATLEPGLTLIDTSGSPASKALRKRKLRVRAAADASGPVDFGLVRRSILFGAREPISIASGTTKVVTPTVSFFGFVDDLSLAGSLVEIVRFGKGSVCNDRLIPASRQVGAKAVTGTVIATAPIQSNGSYGVKVPSSAVFGNSSKKASVVAQVAGSATRKSVAVSLSSANRNNRR